MAGGALAAGLSACTTAPPAATVNGQVISQTELSDYIRGWAASPAYVQEFDRTSQLVARGAQAQGESNYPTFTVEGTGSGPGTFGLPWTAGKLTALVSAVAVHQYLEKHGKEPTNAQRQAAWTSEEAASPTVWPELTPAIRSSVAEATAEEAVAEGKPASASTARKFYQAHLSSYWNRVCLTTQDVSVRAPDGTVDMAASHSRAETVAGDLVAAASEGNLASLRAGARYCLTPEGLVLKQSTFRSEVSSLAVGKAGLVTQPWGYEVVLLRSRRAIPFTAQVAPVIGVVADLSSIDEGLARYVWPVIGGTDDTSLVDILKHADVQVDPAYGSWTTGLQSPFLPQVWPPGVKSP